MSTLETKKIEPLSGTSVTLGAAGDAVTMPAGVTVKTNTVKDAGGNTLWTSDGSGTLSNVNSALQGNMIFISSQTASSSASVEFTSGIDSTYDEYVFYCINAKPASNDQDFSFQVNATGQSGYNEVITSTYFASPAREDNVDASLSYDTSEDQANGTGEQTLTRRQKNDADTGVSGELHLFSPSSTTYVKHFYGRIHGTTNSNQAQDVFVAGYINVTAAITDVRFKFASGNFDGTIALYGIK